MKKIINILVVDDTLTDRKIIVHLLTKSLSDVKIFELDNGYDVSDFIVKHNIQALIIDIMMPGKSGLEVLEELKNDNKMNGIPVVIYTSIDEIESIKKALELGALDYFTKPLSEEVMKISLPLKVKNAIKSFVFNKEIYRLSYYDKLTGLYNRRFFDEELIRLEDKKNYPYSVIVADINGLKIKNDIFGHESGDKLISDIGDVIKSSCRQVDSVCRWGGDEFYILLPSTTNEMVKMICNRISQKCEMSENELVKLSVAVGCATKESEQDDIHQVLKTAEKNMYNDKIKTGRIFYNEVLDKISSKLCIDRIESIEHVAELSEIIMYIGQQLKLTDEEIQKLLLLARYHDVGKIMIDKRIILKPGPLSKSEFEVVVGHSELGYNMVKSFPELLQIADNVLYNHEWWDGTGYPIGLAGDKIPKITRLFAILEAYIVMTQENVYKDAISKEEAITELKRCSGTQFDPYFVELICELIIPGR